MGICVKWTNMSFRGAMPPTTPNEPEIDIGSWQATWLLSAVFLVVWIKVSTLFSNGVEWYVPGVDHPSHGPNHTYGNDANHHDASMWFGDIDANVNHLSAWWCPCIYYWTAIEKYFIFALYLSCRIANIETLFTQPFYWCKSPSQAFSVTSLHTLLHGLPYLNYIMCYI